MKKSVVILILLVVLLTGCRLEELGQDVKYGVLRVENTVEDYQCPRTLYTEIDGIEMNTLGSNSFYEVTLEVGNHTISGHFTIYCSGVLPRDFEFSDTFFISEKGLTWTPL